MNEPIVLPLWAFVVLAGLAGWAALVLLLAPGMRWFLRRRINAVIARSAPASLSSCRPSSSRAGRH